MKKKHLRLIVFSVTLAVAVGVVIGIVAWLCVPRERETPATPEPVALPEIPMDPIKMPDMGGGSWWGGPTFPDDQRLPVVTEAVRRLRTTRHEDTVINALESLTGPGGGAYNHTIETDLIPIVEPFALGGSVRVRAAALVTLCRACRAKSEDDRSSNALSRALTSGVRKLETTAVLAMHPFDGNTGKAEKMALMLLPFFQDPDPRVSERAARTAYLNVRHLKKVGPKSPVNSQVQAALRGFYVKGASLDFRRRILSQLADPRDPAWEPIARASLISGEYKLSLAGLGLLRRTWDLDPKRRGRGTWRKEQLVLDYLVSDEKAKRAFALKYIKEIWARRRGMGKRLCNADHVVELTSEALAELKAAGVPASLIKDFQALKD